MKKKFYRRLWLNKPGFHSSAHVIARVAQEIRKDKKTGKVWKEIDASFLISDCSRNVSLDFSVYGEGARYDRELKNTIYKAHTLLHVVQDFIAALEEAIEENEEER